MKRWQFAVVGLVLLAATGCRTDPYVALRERQLRLQEDEIYRLRETIRELRECGQCEDRPVRPPRSSGADRDEESSRGKTNGAGPLNIEMPSQASPDVPDSLKTPGGSRPPNAPDGRDLSQPPSKSSGPALDGPSLERTPGEVSSRPRGVTMASRAAAAEPFTPSGNSRQVASIVLNHALTGGINSDGRSGDQGLLVVVEPRDRAGRSIDAPAEMSIVALDPALRDEDGMATCVARWDFSAAETAAMFRRTGAAREIHLTTAWPGEPPVHSKLRLFVRYVTADGRKLEANQAIEVALAGEKTTRWDPADAPPRYQRHVEREAMREAWRSDETPTARVPGPSPYMAGRSEAEAAARPLWSPERQ